MLHTPHRPSLLPPILMMAIGSAAFVAVALDVLFRGLLTRGDILIARNIYLHVGRWDTLLCSALSGMGDFRIILPLSLVIGAVLIVRQKRRAAWIWAIGMIGCGILNPALKAAFAIPRPQQYTLFDFANYGGYSFPSGHSMAVTVTAGLLALVYFHLHPLPPARRWIIILAVTLLALIEAFALLYIGVHYLTDLLGALAVSLAWLGVLRVFLPPAQLPSPPVEKPA